MRVASVIAGVRAFMAAAAGAALLATCLDGCAPLTDAEAARDALAGTYALQSVRGQPLPAPVYWTSGREEVETDTVVLAPDGTAEERGSFVYYFSSFYNSPPSRSTVARHGTWTERGGSVEVVWAIHDPDRDELAWWWLQGRLTWNGSGLALQNAGSLQPRTLVYGRVTATGP